MRIFIKKEKKLKKEKKSKFPLLRNLSVGFLAGVIALTAALVPSKTTVFAASVDVVSAGAYFNGEWESMIFYQGTPTYCIQRDKLMPGPYFQTGTKADVWSTYDLQSFNGISENVRRTAAAYTYYGYGYNGRNSNAWYYATQEAIWTLFGYGGNYWSGSVSNDDIQSKKNTIIADANKYLNKQAKPYNFSIQNTSTYSSDDESQAVATYSNEGSNYFTVKTGDTYTITDRSGELAKSVVTQNDFGSRATVSGNTISIQVNDSDYGTTKQIKFGRKSEALEKRGKNLMLYSGSYQNVITQSTPWEIKTYSGQSQAITLYTEGMDVIFDKYNKKGEKISGSSISIYKVNDNNTKSLITSFTTDGTSKKMNLCPGNYVAVETEAPQGYYKAEPVTFTVKSKVHGTQSFSMIDDDIDVSLEKISKKSGENVIGAHMQITSQSTGEVLDDFYTTADDVIKLSSSKYSAGEIYFIKELEAPNGYYVLEDDIAVQIPEYKPADSDLKNGSYVFSVAEDEIDYRALKLDAATDEPVEGATMQLLNSNGDVLDEWVTDKNEHEFDKSLLTVGSTYRIHEKVAPAGYYSMPQDVTFTVSPNSRNTYRVYAYDRPISAGIFKADENGAPVAGATLALYDGNTEIDRWVSTDTAHMVNGLEDGKTYTIKEISPAKGYYSTSTPKEFTVSAKSNTAQEKDIIVNFENETIDYYVQKIDSNTKQRLNGAKFEIIDEDGNTVTEVTSSDAEKVKIPSEVLEAGKTYTVHESYAVDGYYYADGDETFTVPATIEEAATRDKNTFTITVEDKPIKYAVTKVDAETGETVKGALLGLYEEEDSDTPIYTWTTTDEPEKLSDSVGLIAGHEYYVRELTAPDGYYLNDSAAKIAIPYQTDQTGTIKVKFYNQPIKWHISKQDVDGNVLTKINGTSFILEVHDTNETLDNIDDDTLIASLDTSDKTYAANGYFDMASYIKKGLIQGGHHYRIHEKSAANGFLLAEDKIETIKPVGDTNTILTAVQDEKIVVHIKKVDEQGNLLTTYKLLNDTDEGFEITIYNEETGEEVCKFDTSDPSYIANGYYDISDYLSTSGQYVAKETRAPFGYYTAKDYSFTVDSASAIEDKTIVMVDPTLRAQFRKEDEYGNVLTSVDGEGFEFQIIDDATNEVVGTINTKDGDEATGGWIDIGKYLKEARTYRIHEIYAPIGYDMQEKDVYMTTPGYYNESEGTVQNVIISPNEYSTFSINGVSYTEFRSETIDEFSRNHSDTFKIMSVDGSDVLVTKKDEKVVKFSSGKNLTANYILADIEGMSFKY